MMRVMVDGTVEQELRRAGRVAEICDSAGHVIGYFRPRQVPQHLLDLADGNVEELLERGRQRTGRPLSEVISDCEAGADGGRG